MSIIDHAGLTEIVKTMLSQLNIIKLMIVPYTLACLLLQFHDKINLVNDMASQIDYSVYMFTFV